MQAETTNSAILVLTNLPNLETAEKLAETLIASKLAACVNILAPCTSVYEWQGKLEKTAEIPLLIKSKQEKYKLLEAMIVKHHPYELPEVICVPIVTGLPAYLNWLNEHLN
jgi:periplasmic divalent cation tolerance protein